MNLLEFINKKDLRRKYNISVSQKDNHTQYIKEWRTIQEKLHGVTWHQIQSKNPNYLYGLMSRNAIKHGWEWTISFDDFMTFYKEPCHYCGNKIKINIGIDRIDSSKGYMLENIVPCCEICNHGKSDMPYDDFVNYLHSVANFVNSGKI